MNDSKKISVVKVPNDNIVPESTSKPLPRMPRMYLELLENKDKIKPQMLNKDYDPSDAESVISVLPKKIESRPVDVVSNLPTVREDSDLEDENDSVSDAKSSEDDNISISDSDSEQKPSEASSIHSSVRSIEDDQSSVISNQTYLSEKNETKSKIREMLESEQPMSGVQNIPKLSELERDGMIRPNRTVPNLDYLEDMNDEDEEDQKRELLFKFELLKKSYKNANIPEFTIHSSLKKMNETYENQLRHLSLDSSVENYKNILVGGFMVFEFIFGVWLRFDMSGFTQQQILNMSQYERLLIELGQKSYVPEGQQYPVEFRLVGLIILNAVIFIISKMILKRTGNNLMDMMNHTRAPPKEPKKKMRPPNVDFDDL